MVKTNHSGLSQEFQNENSLPSTSQRKALMNHIMGFRTTQILAVAAKLNLAEFLKDGPKTASQLSQLTHTNTQALSRLLRALSNLDIVEANQDDTFSLTPAGQLLCENVPGSLRNVAILYGEEWLWQAYTQLSYSVTHGKQAFEFVHGQTLYEYFQQNSSASDTFNRAMSDFSDTESAAIKEAYNFSGVQTIVDVGGGQGVLVSSILKANPSVSAIVFDLPEVVTNMDTHWATSTDRSHISYVSGDFFKEIPARGDMYILKSVLHNWDESSCIAILQNCRKAMPKDAKLLIIERVIPTGNQKSEAKLFDINMLVMTEGRERTEEEYRKLLFEAGFHLLQTIATQAPVSILECSPRL